MVFWECRLMSPESCGWPSVTLASLSFCLGGQSHQDPCVAVTWGRPRVILPLDRKTNGLDKILLVLQLFQIRPPSFAVNYYILHVKFCCIKTLLIFNPNWKKKSRRIRIFPNFCLIETCGWYKDCLYFCGVFVYGGGNCYGNVLRFQSNLHCFYLLLGIWIWFPCR